MKFLYIYMIFKLDNIFIRLTETRECTLVSRLITDIDYLMSHVNKSLYDKMELLPMMENLKCNM